MLRKIRHHWISDSLHRQNPPSHQAAMLIGAPDDRGVLNVGGRLGASQGPAAVRQMLAQFMLGIEGEVGKIELHEGFDIDLGGSIDHAHAELRRAMRQALESNMIPVVLGGGHDFGFPHAAGASDFFSRKIALINVDAHLDLRPVGPKGITSGSPFYLALEQGVVASQNFVEFGIQPHCNDESFFAYAKKKKLRIERLDSIRNKQPVVARFEALVKFFVRKGLKVVVSFDVDAVQMAHAPGVSSPQIDGFTPGEFLGMASVCGKNPAVASIGFFEFAPPLDHDQKTARLVATALHRFLSGLSSRKKNASLRVRLQKSIGSSRIFPPR